MIDETNSIDSARISSFMPSKPTPSGAGAARSSVPGVPALI